MTPLDLSNMGLPPLLHKPKKEKTYAKYQTYWRDGDHFYRCLECGYTGGVEDIHQRMQCRGCRKWFAPKPKIDKFTPAYDIAKARFKGKTKLLEEYRKKHGGGDATFPGHDEMVRRLKSISPNVSNRRLKGVARGIASKSRYIGGVPKGGKKSYYESKPSDVESYMRRHIKGVNKMTKASIDPRVFLRTVRSVLDKIERTEGRCKENNSVYLGKLLRMGESIEGSLAGGLRGDFAEYMGELEEQYNGIKSLGKLAKFHTSCPIAKKMIRDIAGKGWSFLTNPRFKTSPAGAGKALGAAGIAGYLYGRHRKNRNPKMQSMEEYEGRELGKILKQLGGAVEAGRKALIAGVRAGIKAKSPAQKALAQRWKTMGRTLVNRAAKTAGGGMNEGADYCGAKCKSRPGVVRRGRRKL